MKAMNLNSSVVSQFKGQRIGTSIRLNWIVNNPNLIDYILIEKSTDGITWETVTELESQKEITAKQYFQLIETNITNESKILYRLKPFNYQDLQYQSTYRQILFWF